MYKLPGIIILFLVATLGGYYLWQFGIYAASTFTADRPSFQANLKSTLDLQAGVGKPTFTRATVATVTDFEGLIKNVKSGEARFEGTRRVENLVTNSEAYTDIAGGWGSYGSYSVTTRQVDPDGTTFFRVTRESHPGSEGLYKTISNLVVGNTYRISLYIRQGAQPENSVSVSMTTDGGVTLTVTNTTFIRYSTTFVAGATSRNLNIFSASGVEGDTFDFTKVQLEDVTGQANQNPSEYVSTGVKTSAPYHGANVDGVKYFTTYNGNTVASNVVTEATGAAIPDATLHGYVAEGGRINLTLQSEDFSTSWSASNVNITTNQITSPSGTSTADMADVISSGTSYLYQGNTTVTASTAYTASVYVKLGTLSASNYKIAVYDETNSAFIASDIVPTQVPTTTGWTRIMYTFTTPVGCVKARFYTIRNGGGTGTFYLWGAQLEAGSFASSYIPTTTASVTRNRDVLTYDFLNNADTTKGTAYAELSTEWTTAPSNTVAVVFGNTVGPLITIDGYADTSMVVFDGATVGVKGGLSNMSTGVRKRASSWGGSTMKITGDGLAVSSFAFDGNIGSTRIGVGVDGGGALQWYGTIRNVKIWKKALTDTQLTNLTSTNASVSQSAVKTTTVGADGSSFQADLKNTLDLQAGVGKPTFTRATVATVTDFEGLIKNVKSGEARFEGARRVENLLTYSEDFSNAAWNKSFAGTGVLPIVTANYTTSPTGVITADRIQLDKGAGTTSGDVSQLQYATIPSTTNAMASVWLKSTDGVSSYSVNIRHTLAISATTVTVTGTWKRFSIPVSSSAITTFYIGLVGSLGTSVTADILVWGAQVEDITGQANQNPSEYVSTNVKTSAPYHGAGADGVKYFTTYNGNTTASNVVTEATGANIPDATLHGYVAEGARTNYITYSNFDVWASHWSSGGAQSVTPNTVVSPSGAQNAGTWDVSVSNLLENKSANGNSTYTASLWIKSLTGSPTVNLCVYDNTSSTSRGCTGTISPTSSWQKISVTGTTAGAITGVRFWAIGGGTGTMAVWNAQVEEGSFASSPIPTTTASVTRNGDALTYPTAGNYTTSAVSMYAEMTYSRTVASYGNILSINDTTNNNRIEIGALANANTGYPGAIVTGGTTYLDVPNAGTLIPNILQKFALKAMTTSGKTFINGVQAGNSSSNVILPNVTRIQIADDPSGRKLYGTIRNVKIWKKALTDTQLTNMTSTNTSVSQSAVRKKIIKVTQSDKFTSGLVGMWSFNGPDMSGTTAYDRSGMGNNGTLTGGAKVVLGKNGQGVQFDGVDDYVNANDPVTLRVESGNATWSSWVKPSNAGNSVNYEEVIFDKEGALNGGVFLYIQSNRLRFYNGSGQIGTASIVNGEWYFVTVTKVGSSGQTYVNGVPDKSFTWVANPNSTGVNLNIGGDSGVAGRSFTGIIDEVRIYNRALSANEVTQLYNLGR